MRDFICYDGRVDDGAPEVLCLRVNRDVGGLLAVAAYVSTPVDVFGVRYHVVSGVLSGDGMFTSFVRPSVGSGELVWLLGSGSSVVANVALVVKDNNVDMLFLVRCDNGGVAPGLPELAPPAPPVASNGGGAPLLRRGVGRPNAAYILARVEKMVGKSVAAALSLQYAGPKGVSTRYLRNDLKWDVDHGFLEMPLVRARYVSRFSLGAAGVGGGGGGGVGGDGGGGITGGRAAGGGGGIMVVVDVGVVVVVIMVVRIVLL
jgi:hypothetical protein